MSLIGLGPGVRPHQTMLNASLLVMMTMLFIPAKRLPFRAVLKLIAQTPLLRSVVDLLRNFLYNRFANDVTFVGGLVCVVL